MPIVTFYGSSDDLIEVDGIPGADEFSAYGLDGRVNGSFAVTTKTEGLAVHALYAPARAACWAFAVGQIDEDQPLPDWPIRIRQSQEVAHSIQLEIDVPEDAVLRRIYGKD